MVRGPFLLVRTLGLVQCFDRKLLNQLLISLFDMHNHFQKASVEINSWGPFQIGDVATTLIASFSLKAVTAFFKWPSRGLMLDPKGYHCLHLYFHSRSSGLSASSY